MFYFDLFCDISPLPDSFLRPVHGQNTTKPQVKWRKWCKTWCLKLQKNVWYTVPIEKHGSNALTARPCWPGFPVYRFGQDSYRGRSPRGGTARKVRTIWGYRSFADHVPLRGTRIDMQPAQLYWYFPTFCFYYHYSIRCIHDCFVFSTPTHPRTGSGHVRSLRGRTLYRRRGGMASRGGKPFQRASLLFMGNL